MYYNIPALLYVNADNVVNINKTEQRKRIEILSKNYPIFHVEKIDKHFIKKILFYYNYKYTVQKNSINLQ
jgi:hypothetical protein